MVARAMAEEWVYRIANYAVPAFTGVLGVVGGIYGAGRRSAEREQAIKDELRGDMKSLKEELMDSSSALIEQFRESFAGIRQKINDVELDAQKNFVSKDDFKEFREEYRENTNRIFDKLDKLANP
jgi:hypothetical protein